MVGPGDGVYIKSKSGPVVGKVICAGKHGATVDIGGKQYRVKWSNILGRQKVINESVKVLDQGIDGAVVQHADGRAAYVHGYRSPEPEEDTPEPRVTAWDQMSMAKAQRAVALFMRVSPTE